MHFFNIFYALNQIPIFMGQIHMFYGWNYFFGGWILDVLNHLPRVSQHFHTSGCSSEGNRKAPWLWIRSDWHRIPSKVRWIVLVKLCVKLFWVVATASTYWLEMTGMPIEAPWSPCCMKGLVLLKLLPPALTAGYQAWHSVWSSEALIQQISKVDSVDFSSLRMNIMNYVGVWLLSHARRGQWLWCALFGFVTLSLVVRDRFAIPWDFPWSSPRIPVEFTEVLVLAFTLPPLSQTSDRSHSSHSSHSRFKVMQMTRDDKRWPEKHWKYTDDLSRKMLKTQSIFRSLFHLWLQWDAMSLSGSSLPCWLLLWLFAVAPVVAEAECQSFKTPELWPVMMHICCIAGIEAVCPTGQLSKRAGRVRGSSRSSLDPMFLDVPRCSSFEGMERCDKGTHRGFYSTATVSSLNVRRQIDTTWHDLIWLAEMTEAKPNGGGEVRESAFR